MEQELKKNNQQYSPEMHPRLACKVNLYPERIIFTQNSRSVQIQIDSRSGEMFQKLFSMMDGTKNIGEIQQILFPRHPQLLNTILTNLDKEGLLDDVVPLRVYSGMDTILELEDLTQELLSKKQIEENLFSQPIQSNLLYGFGIEYYHVFSRKCSFHSPVLGFPGSTKVRQLMNQQYLREYGQEELLLEALNTVGISGEDLARTTPLPETMAICHGLSYWANFEPLFFLSILSLFTKSQVRNFQSYIKAIEQFQGDSPFIEPIRKLTNQLIRKPESLTRSIFQEISPIDKEKRQRLRGQTYLFVEMLNNFSRAIGKHYSSTQDLLRV
ncbi:MAG: hypothetical protein GDA44_08775 [Prochloron sp. SP5CPC1]|nr:hypothetical protein [Candidatus Paraprochloron terpiosi SP5CPC1]